MGIPKGFLKDTEKVFSFLCGGIALTWIYWGYLNTLLIITLFVYWLFFVKKNFSIENPHKIILTLFILYYLFVIAGYFYSENKELAMIKIEKKSPMLILPLIFATTPGLSKNLLHHCLRILIGGMVLAIILFQTRGLIHLFFTGKTTYLFGYEMMFINDMYPFMLGLCTVILINYIFFCFKHDMFTSARQKKIYIAISLLFIYFLFILANRNVLITLMLLLVYYSFQLIKSFKIRTLIIAGLMGLSALSILVVPSIKRQWKDLSSHVKYENIEEAMEHSMDGRDWGGWVLRQGLWYCSMDIIKEHWLWGVGGGDAQATSQAAYEKYKFYFASRYNSYNSHNQYIQQIIIMGVFGLVILLGLYFYPLVVFWKDKFIRLYMIIIILMCLTEAILEINKGIILFSFLSTIILFTTPTRSIRSLA